MIQVSDGLFRGPRPETDAQKQELVDAGIRTIINLEMGYFDFFHRDVNEEVQWFASLGVTVIHLQIGDIFAPSKADLHAITWLVRDALNLGRVYIHCLHGVDRTGLAVAMVQRYLFGMTPEQAIADMYANGFHKFPYQLFGWVRRLRDCL